MRETSGRVIFLLEEPSMKALLEGLLPRLVPGWVSGQHFLCVPHEGKSALEKSIPLKLKAFREPGARFVIVRDNDGGDCVATKARLRAQCLEAGRPETLIRLVCQELEGWYLGDLRALGTTFGEPSLDRPGYRKKYADPDRLLKPSREVQRLVPSFQKLGGARQLGQTLAVEGNRSRSFQVFVSGVSRLAQEPQSRPAER